MSQQKHEPPSTGWQPGTGIAPGLVLGVVHGLILDNLALGIGLGLAVGTVIDVRGPWKIRQCRGAGDSAWGQPRG